MVLAGIQKEPATARARAFLQLLQIGREQHICRRERDGPEHPDQVLFVGFPAPGKTFVCRGNFRARQGLRARGVEQGEVVSGGCFLCPGCQEDAVERFAEGDCGGQRGAGFGRALRCLGEQLLALGFGEYLGVLAPGNEFGVAGQIFFRVFTGVPIDGVDEIQAKPPAHQFLLRRV